MHIRLLPGYYYLSTTPLTTAHASADTGSKPYRCTTISECSCKWHEQIRELRLDPDQDPEALMAPASLRHMDAYACYSGPAILLLAFMLAYFLVNAVGGMANEMNRANRPELRQSVQM
jgi:hypothetical protein